MCGHAGNKKEAATRKTFSSVLTACLPNKKWTYSALFLSADKFRTLRGKTLNIGLKSFHTQYLFRFCVLKLMLVPYTSIHSNFPCSVMLLELRSNRMYSSHNRTVCLNSKAPGGHRLMTLQQLHQLSLPSHSSSPLSPLCWRWSPQVNTHYYLWAMPQ